MPIKCLLFILLISSSSSSLHSRFKHFEEIDSDNIWIREKRDAKNLTPNAQHVHFSSLGRAFQLQLFPDTRTLNPEFEVRLIDGDGLSTSNDDVSASSLFSGHETGNTRNKVSAVLHGDIRYFYIKSDPDVFVVEPAWRLDSGRPRNHLIAYKMKDLLENSTRGSDNQIQLCNHKIKGLGLEAKYAYDIKEYFVQRQKRSLLKKKPKEMPKRYIQESDEEQSETPSYDFDYEYKDTCDILFVVDYETYKGVGQSSPAVIVTWLSHVLQNVNSALRNSGLSVDGATLGVRMKAMIIHTSYTKVTEGTTHYNMADNKMGVEQTLDSFKINPRFGDYCLAHLVTQRLFGGTLGQAVLASSQGGGICGEIEAGLASNVALTTPIDANGTPLPIEMHVMTMAHEIGHNFGAAHDPATPTCSPDSSVGGKYLMWPYSGSQRGVNRMFFSPCSMRQMTRAIRAKSHKCFTPQNSATQKCGDGLVGPGEDCDFGIIKDGGTDICCTRGCRFRYGAVCSPSHHPCCTHSCQVSSASTPCTPPHTSSQCRRQAFCDGTTALTCPRAPPLPDGQACGAHGRCWGGTCLSFCHSLAKTSRPPRNLQDCNCDNNRTMMCRHCCTDLEAGGEKVCQAMGGQRSERSICLEGMCVRGECRPIGVNLGHIGVGGGEVGGKSESHPHTLTIVFVFVACASAFIVLMGSLFAGKNQTNSRKMSENEELALEELRQMLEDIIGPHNTVQSDKDSQINKLGKGTKHSDIEEEPGDDSDEHLNVHQSAFYGLAQQV